MRELRFASVVFLCAAGAAGCARADRDWLVTGVTEPVSVVERADGKEVVMDNTLIRRTFRLRPNAATVGYDNLMTGESMLRGVKPEARVEIDGVRFDVGGLQGQPDYAYLLNEWLDSLRSNPEAFRFAGYEIGRTKERFAWRRRRYCADTAWPPAGASLSLHFKPPAGKLKGLRLSVHYEMYEGIPLLCKWLSVHNGSGQTVRLNSYTSEILAMVEYESHVENYEKWNVPNIHVESDYSFAGMNAYVANQTTHWEKDPEYMTQVSYPRENPCLLESRPPVGPDQDIEPGGTFESFRTFELVFDSTERERKGLAVRRMYRTIAPWVTENPIMMHVRRADPKSVRLAIDQCAEVGFEMVILTFGSGFNIENEAPEYLAQMKELADYAHSKEIEIGGYSLLSSRRISDEHDVIDKATGRPGGAKFGNAPCIGSKWGQEYFRRLYAFFEKTGFDLLEHDGSYPGDTCASTSHPGHRGYEDSQWAQWKVISDFYKWCRGRGIYLNVPDFYYLAGSTKCAMGYRETNWSLPRAQQIIHGRQNIYDGTWTKTPSMGWMFVPLVQYHGGGAPATLEPLSEHRDAYEAHLAQNFGSGVQACYRGPRLYDTDQTKAIVKKWVEFYKKYRAILDSDIIHVRRADGRDIDCILHVNPELKHKGLAMVYNPLSRKVEKKLKLPLYYTGLTETARIREREGRSRKYKLDRGYNVTVPVSVEARGVTWFVIE
ncbi:MAG: alpha-galactosidase [Planctomycetes bacterium]|nr:alpha-galactosidase [Planctomycetota bacterium]